jgi:hypothetical protein
LELLIKKAGIHEGKWVLAIKFGFSVLNAGPTPEQIVPTALIGIQTIGVQKALPEAPEALLIDASVVNPAST